MTTTTDPHDALADALAAALPGQPDHKHSNVAARIIEDATQAIDPEPFDEMTGPMSLNPPVGADTGGMDAAHSAPPPTQIELVAARVVRLREDLISVRARKVIEKIGGACWRRCVHEEAIAEIDLDAALAVLSTAVSRT